MSGGGGGTAWVCSRAQRDAATGREMTCQDLFLEQGMACLKLVYADDVCVEQRNGR